MNDKFSRRGHEVSVDDDPLAIEVSASDVQTPHSEAGGVAAEARGGADGGTAGGVGEYVDSAHRVFEHEEPDTWTEIGAIPHDGSPECEALTWGQRIAKEENEIGVCRAGGPLELTQA